MSYEFAPFVPAKREDHDNARVDFDAESQQIFRMSRVLSPQGQAVMEYLAATTAPNYGVGRAVAIRAVASRHEPLTALNRASPRKGETVLNSIPFPQP